MFADVMAALLESCLRASMVLCAAWAITSAMRRASASTRHFVWMSAIAGAMIATAMSFAGPRWTVPVPSPFSSTTAAAIVPSTAPDVETSAVTAPSSASRAETTQPAPSLSSTPVARPSIDLTLLGVFLWAAGALSVLAFVIVGAVGTWWIRRYSTPLQAAWVDEAHVLAEAFEVNGSIKFVESKAVTMPMVCGVWRPLIVMPHSATEWPDERRRVVVLHELAHVKRRDCLTQALAYLVCAVYWFNPIVWLAARRLRAERERACDDFVLSAGEKGSDYAAHLLDIAQTMRHRSPALVGLAMARPSQLEGRLLAILDPAIRRSSTLHTRLALLGFVSLVTLPVGAVQLQGSAPADTREAVIIEEPAPPASSAPSLQAMPTSTRKPESTPVAQAEAQEAPRRQAQLETLPEAIAAGVGAEVGHAVGAEVGQALGAKLGQQIGAALSAQAGAAADPKTIEALIGALGDSDPDVREMVVVTLGRMRDPRIVPALLPLLKDSNTDVREQAVFALARSGDPRATAAVSTMIDDGSPDVRQQVVHLLGQSRNRDAVPVLIKALKDSSADVREQAAFGLGQLRDVGAVDPLLEMLKDSSPDVREQTAFALGQLRDRKAVDGLMAALKDSNPDVREQAAFALGQIRDPKALPSLTAALRDSTADVREQAAFAIGQISGQQ
jgi:HEAT repeat protein/beta-lactamase regulating signal transducer with metallopeptidase domain